MMSIVAKRSFLENLEDLTQYLIISHSIRAHGFSTKEDIVQYQATITSPFWETIPDAGADLPTSVSISFLAFPSHVHQDNNLNIHPATTFIPTSSGHECQEDMARHSKAVQAAGEQPEQQRGLLSSDPDIDLDFLTSDTPDTNNSISPAASPSMSSSRPTPSPIIGQMRSSSLRQHREDGQPRTPNRVRFLETDDRSPPPPPPPRNAIALGWIDDEDFLHNSEDEDHDDNQRRPLLTEIEAPSVTVASADIGFNAEDLLESARPKSGLRSAFMNMANSIMYVSPGVCNFATGLTIDQRRWYHRATLRFQTGGTLHWHPTTRLSYCCRGLDDSTHSDQLEIERHRLFPSHRTALLWPAWTYCCLLLPMGVVRGYCSSLFNYKYLTSL